MTDSDKEWLRKLNNKIWKTEPTTLISNPSVTNYRTTREERTLTASEKKKVSYIFCHAENELIFEPGGGTFGFGVSITAYIPPSYP